MSRLIQTLLPKQDTMLANHSIWNWGIAQAGKFRSTNIGCWDWPELYPQKGNYAYQGRALYQYGDFPELPEGSLVIKAILKVYIQPSNPALSSFNQDFYKPLDKLTLDIHRITQEWEEGLGSPDNQANQESGVTWTRRTRSRFWNTNGGDIEVTPTASKEVSYQSQWVDFDITNLYKKWINGEAPNYGVMIKIRDDNTPRGMFFTWTRESESKVIPVLEIEYNDPPSPARALMPAHQSTVCPAWKNDSFSWKFVDYQGEVSGREQLDAVFLIDVSGSTRSMRPTTKKNIENFIDKLDKAKVDWRIGFVTYSNVNVKDPIDKWDYVTTKAAVIKNFDGITWRTGAYHGESGLESIKDPKTGALTFPRRTGAEVHFYMVGDEPLHDRVLDQRSIYTHEEVATELKNLKIILHNINKTNYESQVRKVSDPTGGLFFDFNKEWHDNLPLPKKVPMAGNVVAEDTQTKAEVNIWRIGPTGTRTFVKTLTVNGASTKIDMNPQTIPLITNTAYEWNVVTYDTSLLKSTSKKAIFTFRDDLRPYEPFKSWQTLPKHGDVVKKDIFTEIKEELLRVAPTFRSIRRASIEDLFKGDIVPSSRDFQLLKAILTTMLSGSNLPIDENLRKDIIENSLDFQDIQHVRNVMDRILKTGPVAPGVMTATKVDSYLSPPETIQVETPGPYSGKFTVRWGESRLSGSGIIINTSESISDDVLAYRVYHNYSHKVKRYGGYTIRYDLNLKLYVRENLHGLQDSTDYYYTDYMFTPQQFEKSDYLVAGTIDERQLYLESDGSTDSDTISVRALDAAGFYSPSRQVQIIDQEKGKKPWGEVFIYFLEYQVLPLDATEPNLTGSWRLLGMTDRIGKREYVASIKAYGSIWFRVSAMSMSGELTDYTYSTTKIVSMT